MRSNALGRKFIVATAVVLLFTAVAVLAQARKVEWEWRLEKEATGGWGSYYGETTVRATCDGPHRVYIARSIGTNSDPLALAVVPNGCVKLPAEEAP